MIRSGDVIAKLVWVVPEARCRDLDKIIFFRVRMWKRVRGNFLRSNTGARTDHIWVSGNEPERKTPFQDHHRRSLLISKSEDGRVYSLRPEMIIQIWNFLALLS